MEDFVGPIVTALLSA